MPIRRSLLFTLALLLCPAAALAHGGLPISQQIFVRNGGELVVPTTYWGVFIGREGGPFTWICEEAINKNQFRRWAMTGDGTFLVNGYTGVDLSRDGGCTWSSVGGELSTRPVVGLIGDPSDPKRAWAATAAGVSSAATNAIYTTPDDGATWTAKLTADEFLRGVVLSADGRTLYAIGLPRNPPAGTFPVPVLHVSRDAGATWTDTVTTYQLNGRAPQDLVPLGVDPADPSVAYFAAYTSDPTAPDHSLLRASAYGATLTEQFQLRGDINGVVFDQARGAVLAPTAMGMWRSAGGAAFAKSGNLSQAQCATVSGSTVYACSWNYEPDNAAVARSDDGVQYQSIFRYAQTVGPDPACGPTTPVGQMCPDLWLMYASQLGIDVDGGLAGDAGVGDGGAPKPQSGCSCDVGGGRERATPGAAMLLLVAAALGLRARKERT